MEHTATVFHALQYLQIVGFAFLFFRLVNSKLIGTYRYFTMYVVFQVVRMVLTLVIPYRSNAFGYFFFTCEPIVWILSALAILEVYGIVLRNHPGIETWGRWGLTGSIAASVVLSFATLLLDYQSAAEKYPILANFFLLSKLVTISLLLFVVLITFCLLWFPITLNRNTVVHCCVFAGYFFIKATTYIVALMMPGGSFVFLNIAVQVLVLLCCTVWIFGLSAEGENIPVKIGHYWDSAQEDRLMAQLDSINRTLVHSAKE
ncbi:MAG: hypothetical protein ABJF23_23945 [Bryobacteraceae bacterium]